VAITFEDILAVSIQSTNDILFIHSFSSLIIEMLRHTSTDKTHKLTIQ